MNGSNCDTVSLSIDLPEVKMKFMDLANQSAQNEVQQCDGKSIKDS